jgi:hypothetical protein
MVSVQSKKPEIARRAAEIAEKILGTPQAVERDYRSQDVN